MDWLTRLAEESNLEQAVSDCYTAALDAGDSQLVASSKAAGGTAHIAAGMPIGADCGVGHSAAGSHCGALERRTAVAAWPMMVQ